MSLILKVVELNATVQLELIEDKHVQSHLEQKFETACKQWCYETSFDFPRVTREGAATACEDTIHIAFNSSAYIYALELNAISENTVNILKTSATQQLQAKLSFENQLEERALIFVMVLIAYWRRN